VFPSGMLHQVIETGSILEVLQLSAYFHDEVVMTVLDIDDQCSRPTSHK
jgi:hypothetical protein